METPKIVVILGAKPFHDFWTHVADGAIASGQRVGFAVDIVNVATVSELSAAITAAKQDPLVVGVVAPLFFPEENAADFTSLVSPPNPKPLVTINSGLGKDVGQITHIGSNATASGYDAAAYFNKINKQHAVCLVFVAPNTQAPINAGLSDRCAAAEARFNGKFSVAEVSTTAEIAAVLAADPTIDAVYATGQAELDHDPVAALLSLDDADSRSISFVYHDLSSLGIQQLQAGQVDWIIGQQPYLQGSLPVMILFLKIQFGETPLNKIIQTGPIFYDSETIIDQIPFKDVTW